MNCRDCKTPSTCSFNGCDKPSEPARQRPELADFLAWWEGNPPIPPPQDVKAIAWAAWHARANS